MADRTLGPIGQFTERLRLGEERRQQKERQTEQDDIKTILSVAKLDPQGGADAWNKNETLTTKFGTVNFKGSSKDQRLHFYDGVDPKSGQTSRMMFNVETEELSEIGAVEPRREPAGPKEPTASEKTQRKKNVFAIQYLQQGTFPDRTTMGTFLSTPIQTDDDILNTLFVTGANPEDAEVQDAIMKAAEAIAPKDPVERESWLKSLVDKYIRRKSEGAQEAQEVEDPEEAKPVPSPRTGYASMGEEELFAAAQGGDRNAWEEAKRRGLAK